MKPMAMNATPARVPLEASPSRNRPKRSRGDHTYSPKMTDEDEAMMRHRETALTYRRWSHLIGYPSVLFVLVFAGVGASLYLARARQAAAAPSFDLRNR